jgi:hypothetical protein
MLKEVEVTTIQRQDFSRVHALKLEVGKLLCKEEKMRRQRAHTEWIKARDKNTRFFHQASNQR